MRFVTLIAVLACTAPVFTFQGAAGPIPGAWTPPNLSGRWNPVEPSAAVPLAGTTAENLVASLGGPVTITQDATTLTIDNGVLKLICGPDAVLHPPPNLILAATRAGGMRGLLTTSGASSSLVKMMNWGWAQWMQPSLLIRTQGGPPLGTTIRFVYSLEQDQLEVQRAIERLGKDVEGTFARVRYVRLVNPK